jgi:peroxiredoxin
MKRKAWISNAIALVLTAALLPAADALAAATQVGDFSLIDHQGLQHQLSRLGNHKAVVVIAQSNSCAENVEQLHRYKHLRTTWKKQGVEFLMLNASREDNLDSIRKMAKLYDVDFPIMYDESQLAAESLDITKAGEVLVIEPNSRKLIFRGSLDRAMMRGAGDDAGPSVAQANAAQRAAGSPLADALGRAVAGTLDADTVTLPPPAKGCDIAFPVRAAHAKAMPDYSADVAPIIKSNCARCHVEGGIAPFAMSSYEIVRGFAPMIREVLLTKRMPPVQVDPYVGHFDNANYISNNELQTLVHWIDAGAPRGKGKDALKAIKPIQSEWQLGKPDLIVEVPAFDVPATGVIDYFNHTIDLPFNEDRYVRAVQFLPGDNRVLHHLLSYITSPDWDRSKGVTEENVRDFLEGYAPGKGDATVFPKGTGVFIPAGFKLIMQMHYTPMGKAITDKTRVGLYFYDKDKPPQYKYQTLPVSNGGPNLVIPPGEQAHALNAQHVFDVDTTLYALRPHMHYRGKAFTFKAIYPDGTNEILMNVPDYNFAWQPTYRLSQPKMLPAGTRVVTYGIYDNSKFNRGNPDPTATVRGGPQSWDEMFIGYFTFTQAPVKDEAPGEGKERVSSR